MLYPAELPGHSETAIAAPWKNENSRATDPLLGRGEETPGLRAGVSLHFTIARSSAAFLQKPEANAHADGRCFQAVLAGALEVVALVEFLIDQSQKVVAVDAETHPIRGLVVDAQIHEHALLEGLIRVVGEGGVRSDPM